MIDMGKLLLLNLYLWPCKQEIINSAEDILFWNKCMFALDELPMNK